MTAAKGSLASFTDLEMWHWHAYDYGWRRIFISNFDTRSTLDPDGDWFNARLADEAEDFLRALHKRPVRKHHAPPATPDTIRDNCKQIPWSELNDIEREVLMPDFETLAARAKQGIGAVEKRSRRAMRFDGPYAPRWEGEPAAEHVFAPPRDDPATIDRVRASVGLPPLQRESEDVAI